MEVSDVFFPKQEEAFRLAFGAVTGLNDIDFITYGGAIRGGKTVWGIKTLLFLCEIYPGSRWAIVRATHDRLRQNTIPSFNKIRENHGTLKSSPYEYIHPNGSVILFISENYASDKDLNAFKGLEVNGFLLEEINEIQFKTLNKCFERAGSWIIPSLEVQPQPLILSTCNPTQEWVKEYVYDRFNDGTLPSSWAYIPSKITDNPFIPESYKKSLLNLPQYEYEVYVEGNWDISLKTGNEFWRSFEINKHVKNVLYDPNTTIHISIDNNVLPYIAITFWQIYPEQKLIRQIEELKCTDPDNTASRAGLLAAERIKRFNYSDVVFIYGDASTKSRNTIDEHKRTFYDIFEEQLKKIFAVRDRVPKSNTSVALKGDFINALYDGWEGWSIEIGEHCKGSISDYIDVKTNKDGGMLKEKFNDRDMGSTYEKNGHLSDTKKDFIAECLNVEFRKWQNKGTNFSNYELDEPENSNY